MQNRIKRRGERPIVMTDGQFNSEELKTYCPTVVLVNEENQGVEVRRCDHLLTTV